MSLFLQALIIALLTWYVATAMPMFLRWSFYFGAPLVAGLINGLLFGDVMYGLKVGANIQMAYLGMVAVGGALPSDMALAGYLGTALAMAVKLPPEAALTVAVPLGALGLICFNAKMTLNAIWVHKAETYAKEGNIKGVRNMNLFASQIFPILTYFIPSFIALYFGSKGLERVLSIVPTSVINALKVTGGLIPALGIGMLLSYLWKKDAAPYFIVGFILSAYLKLDVMSIAILGGCIAAVYVFNSRKRGAVNEQ
ncbi:MAG: sugar transporter subunit [Clostridia bacterium]|jgi:mannose/fructose/N-acetylgalactosamine-specific phosphotransferase system component IIC|nr:sugar transporter subunit [Clostridia bacterium]